MKILKIIILTISFPLLFIVIGVIGTIAFINLLIDNQKRHKLMGI